MDHASLALALAGPPLAGLLFAAASGAADLSEVPGVVVDHSPQATGIYLGSPGIAVLPDGDYLAKSDEFGPAARRKARHVTRLYRSKDRGRTWRREADFPASLFWASLFVHRGHVYLMGVGGRGTQTVISRSTDGGRTWTVPRDASSGVLLAEGRYHCAPVPVVVHEGRLWRAMEDRLGKPDRWGAHFRAFMMSAPADADLLQASAWTSTNRLARDPRWLEGRFGGWLEGNAVVTPEGQVVNILRVHTRPHGGKAAVVHVSDDGRTASFDPQKDFIDFPGGCKKFTIRADPHGGGYWALANYIPPFHRGGNPERTRNTLALIRSDDLRRWTVRCVLLYHPDVRKHGFQYPDWLFEGDDLVVLSRTAYHDGLGGAHNQHDANLITFHRVAGFRDLTMDDSHPAFLERAR
ncbi:MAG: sialidase family protein [Candidatus Brocadiia bacterium]